MFEKIVDYRAPILLVVLCIAVFGSITYAELPRESFPDIDIPTVFVSTPYIGVAPEDIEKLVTVPIENELSGLNDLKKMSSTSAEGVSLIALEFEPDVIIEDKLQRVRDRVSRARPKLPEDTEETDVQEVSLDAFPIMIVTISGPADEERLKALGEKLEDDIRRIPGVLDTKLSGGRERQFRVEVDPIRLSHYKLSLNDIIGAVNAENVNIPGGDVTAGKANFLVRVPGDFDAAKDIEKVGIKRIGDRPVFVSDVATVVDGFEERKSYARVNGEPAVTLAVMKRAGANILDIAKEVKVSAAKHAERWPKGVVWRVLGDQSKDIELMVADLENNIITALILVVAVIMFFMGARNSLFVAVTIPMTMLVTMLVVSWL
ncbi:MAG: efflux RND transporter permease subunit, partial [Myxococcales bacterium]|nr:efflux RND transporter permease subunit [Myxococcales bacterium]